MAIRSLIVSYETDVELDSLVDDEANCNQADDGALIEMIDANGWAGVIIAESESRVIRAGHGRKRALRALGESRAPAVLWVATDGPDHAARVRLGDNRACRLGYDDLTKLVPVLTRLADSPVGLRGSGFDGDDLDALLADQRDAAVRVTGDWPAVEPKTTTCPNCGHVYHL